MTKDGAASLLTPVRKSVVQRQRTDRKDPPEATSRSRKAGVPEAVERVIVAPFPWIVTFAVITGRPVPPSLELLMDVKV